MYHNHKICTDYFCSLYTKTKVLHFIYSEYYLNPAYELISYYHVRMLTRKKPLYNTDILSEM